MSGLSAYETDEGLKVTVHLSESDRNLIALGKPVEVIDDDSSQGIRQVTIRLDFSA